MAIPYYEAGETALGRLERAGDKWGLAPFRDKTMKGKKTRRNEADNTNEHPPSPAGAGVLGWCSEGSVSPLRPDLATPPPPLPTSYLENRSQVTWLVRAGLLTADGKPANPRLPPAPPNTAVQERPGRGHWPLDFETPLHPFLQG